ncbi:hypothetical protein ABK040_001478 [Willaertia magna]
MFQQNQPSAPVNNNVICSHERTHNSPCSKGNGCTLKVLGIPPNQCYFYLEGRCKSGNKSKCNKGEHNIFYFNSINNYRVMNGLNPMVNNPIPMQTQPTQQIQPIQPVNSGFQMVNSQQMVLYNPNNQLNKENKFLKYKVHQMEEQLKVQQMKNYVQTAIEKETEKLKKQQQQELNKLKKDAEKTLNQIQKENSKTVKQLQTELKETKEKTYTMQTHLAVQESESRNLRENLQVANTRITAAENKPNVIVTHYGHCHGHGHGCCDCAYRYCGYCGRSHHGCCGGCGHSRYYCSGCGYYHKHH